MRGRGGTTCRPNTNHDGVVCQKDLGKNSKKIAQAMKAFNPDATWEKAEAPTAAQAR